MKVLEFLKKIAADAGIIQIIAEASHEAEMKAEKSVQDAPVTISLDKLIEQQNAKDFTNSVQAPELDVDFETIYKMLKVVPPLHHWDVDKLLEILNSPPVKGRGRDDAKKMIQEMLAENNIPSQDIIKDAVSRDGALDTYEQFVFKQSQGRGEKRQARIDALKKQMDECRCFIDQLQAAQGKEAAAFSQWVAKKTAKEEQLVEVVSFLTPDTVISVGPVTKEKQKH
ncbi:MAG: hypothetical protein WCI27_01390 [Candidatus Omnitrophota bacterium]